MSVIGRYTSMKPLLPFLLFTTLAFSQADSTLVRNHMVKLTKTNAFRNHKNIGQLNATAAYIGEHFQKFADTVYEQPYLIEGKTYKNVIASFNTHHPRRIVIGAHYDVCGEQEGADDNASGVTGLLELSRLLKGNSIPYRIDLVGYTLEEPPYFDGEEMGSYIHAKSLKDEGADVYGMISLEMIGYFDDRKKSQAYPIDLLTLFYGNRGDYITLVKKWGAKSFTRSFIRKYKRSRTVKAKKFSAPTAVTGITLSDHFNYWNFGYDALMITDTSFYRNKNYHENTDTLETLDIGRMTKVIDGVFVALSALE